MSQVTLMEMEEYRREATKKFFTHLWGTEPCTVTISLAMVMQKGTFSDSRFLWPNQFDEMYHHIESRQETFDVFMTPARFVIGAQDRQETSVDNVYTLSVDLDQDNNEDAREALETLGGFVVSSGSPGHYHGYLPLKEPVSMAHGKALNKRLKFVLNGDNKESPGGVLRVPYTTNFKKDPTEDDPREVTPLVDLDKVKRIAVNTAEKLIGFGKENYEEVEDFDLSPEEVKSIPGAVENILNKEYEEGRRSEGMAALVATCVESGLTPGQTAELALNWDVARAKHKTDGRIKRDVQRLLKKFRHLFAETQSDSDWDLTFLDETDERPPSPFIVQNMLPESGLIIWTGWSGSGKSFVALDMALSVAHGKEWAGHKVKRGKVLYVAMEGQNGLVQRARVWHRLNDEQFIRDFAVLELNFSLKDDRAFNKFVDTVQSFQPSLIVIDTVAHAMVGLEENSASEMSVFITRVSEVRRICNSTIVLVHHASKDDKDKHGSRGSGALPAAADAGFKMEKAANSSNIKLSCTKQKDIEVPPPHMFNLVGVPVNQVDYWGDPVPDPAVAVFDHQAAKGSSDEVTAHEAGEEIYTALQLATYVPMAKAKFIKESLGRTGRSYNKFATTFDDLLDWGVVVPTPETAGRERGVTYVLAENHVSRFEAWVESPMMKADTEEEGTE